MGSEDRSARRRRASGLGLWCLAALMPFSFGHAQEPPPTRPAETSARTLPLEQIAAKLSRETGLPVRVASDVATQRTTLPAEFPTADTLEPYLDSLTHPGSLLAWAKVYLPAPPTGRRYSGDALAQFAVSEIRLVGRVPKAATETVTILGKRMTPQGAQPYLKGLGLEPYYVLFSRRLQLSGMGVPPPGAMRSDPISDSLLKQLGVAHVQDIPPGEYVVPVTNADGSVKKAHIMAASVNGMIRLSFYFSDN